MIKIAERTINDEIDDMIDYKIQQMTTPIQCIIKKLYDDGYADILLEDESILKYVQVIGKPVINSDAILIFAENTTENPVCIASNDYLLQKFGLNQASADQFNYAIIKKKKDTITYEELWILANAYYDYSAERFVKINPKSTSFGIQIQANGTYPGESELGYTSNTGINIWRNPISTEVWKDTTNYDYTDFDNKHHIGCKRKSDNEWIEFGISAGWNNSFMIDSYGGMTIGGSGFEIDGNGLYPFTRLSHSIITISGTQYALLGLLDNAYHGSTGCDDNSTYSWFIGLKTPVTNNTKDNTNTSFVIMYNDTTDSNQHTIDNSEWHIVFEVNTGGIVS